MLPIYRNSIGSIFAVRYANLESYLFLYPTLVPTQYCPRSFHVPSAHGSIFGLFGTEGDSNLRALGKIMHGGVASRELSMGGVHWSRLCPKSRCYRLCFAVFSLVYVSCRVVEVCSMEQISWRANEMRRDNRLYYPACTYSPAIDTAFKLQGVQSKSCCYLTDQKCRNFPGAKSTAGAGPTYMGSNAVLPLPRASTGARCSVRHTSLQQIHFA